MEAITLKRYIPVGLMSLGVANTLAYSPFQNWWLPFVTLYFLITAINSAGTAKQAARYGFYYGLGWFGAGISWVHVAIADFGGLPLIASVFLMALLVGYLALFPALASWLTFKNIKRFQLWGFPVFWLVAEFLRATLFTGFPWLSLGYSQLEGPFRALAPIVGEFGLQAVVAVMAVSVYQFIFNVRHALGRKIDGLAITLIIFILGLNIYSTQKDWTGDLNRTVRLALVQGNIEQSIKWQPENELPTMEKYLSMSTEFFSQHDLIIWPEAAIPRLEILANDYLREVDKLAAETNTALITGIVDYQPETNLAYNNIIVLGKKLADDQFGHYRYLHNNRFNKHHLLTIGEFVPFESVLRKLGPIFDLPMSSFSRGYYQQDNLIAQSLKISPAICFEIAFSEQVRDNLYDNSDIILTVSNDAWFGASHGPWQHLQIAQMRALEFAKPVVRVTNNGITAIIDQNGEIVSLLPQFKAAVLSHKLDIYESNTIYREFGNSIAWLSVILILLLSLISRRLQPASLLNKQS